MKENKPNLLYKGFYVKFWG